MKVGDYVRTEIIGFNIQKIGKIKEIYSEDIIHTDVGTYDITDIVKSSPNIIDLIKVGDYVNGCMVINKKDDTIQIIQLIIPFDLKEKDIKSIVTKEMFSQMEYKL